MAIAAGANGTLLVATEDFGSTKATVVALFERPHSSRLRAIRFRQKKSLEAAMFVSMMIEDDKGSPL